MRRRETTQEEAEIAAQTLEQADLSIVPGRGHLAVAMSIAVELDHPAYDAVYLAVAEASELSLVTADDNSFGKSGEVRTGFGRCSFRSRKSHNSRGIYSSSRASLTPTVLSQSAALGRPEVFRSRRAPGAWETRLRVIVAALRPAAGGHFQCKYLQYELPTQAGRMSLRSKRRSMEQIADNLPEVIFPLLAPFYENFRWFRLTMDIVRNRSPVGQPDLTTRAARTPRTTG